MIYRSTTVATTIPTDERKGEPRDPMTSVERSFLTG
jgi:hypothetical protein